MNKVININLAGFVYNMDEIAYDFLKEYLSEVKLFLKNTEDAEEIMRDIEHRIAEIFKTQLHGHQVITQADVEEVIQIMGRPESYLTEDDEAQAKSQETSTHATYQKRLFRNPENKYIAGVCGGLAAYFGINAIWIRILILILLIFFIPFIPTLLGYIIFWILVPYAKTTSEKLQMHGEPVNFDTIKKSFEKQSASVDSKLRATTSRTVVFFEKVMRRLYKWAVAALGVFFIFGGLMAITLWCSFLFASIYTTESSPWFPFINFLIYSFDSTPVYYLSVLCVSFLILIPSVIGILLGINILYRDFQLKRSLIISLIILWCIAMASSILLGVMYTKQFSYDALLKKILSLNEIKHEYNIIFNEYPEKNTFEYPFYQLLPGLIFKDKIISPIEVSLKKSNDGVAYAEIIRSSRGNSRADSQEKAQNIQYRYHFDPDASTAYFDNFSSIPLQTPFRHQNVKLQIYLPEGQIFKMKNWKPHRFYHTEGWWEMTQDGPECITLGCPYRDDEDLKSIDYLYESECSH